MQTNAQTIQLATWDFANANTTPTLASGIGSATIATSGNIQVSSSFTNSFSVTNLSATTLAQAKNGNGTIPAYYISVTISPNPNFAIDISSVAIQGFSQNRNRTFNLSYIDAQSNLINVQNRTIATPTQAQTFTVSSLTGIQTPIELRFYIFSNPADLYEAAGFGEAAGLDLVINGKITNTTTNPILPGMWSLQGNTVAGTQFFGSVNNEALKIYTNNTEKVRIDSDGNVGIGTTAPTQKLSVAGNINLTGTGTGLIFDDGTFANSWQPVLANSAAISILNTSLSGLTNTVNANFTTLQTSILGIGQAIDIQQTTNQILSSSIVGVSANLANTQTTVANLQTALANSTNSLNNGITFSGAKFDIYTPVQGQYNGYKPIMSMSQYGEINFNSSPYLNDNAMYFGNTGNFNNGIRKANDFGGVGGYSGPVVFGENGGALGSSTANSNWTTTGTKLALSWDANQTVKIHKALQFADGTVQTTAGSNWEMTNNYLTYPQNVNVQGTLKLGTNSLYLGGVSGGIPGSTNEIYTDNGALEIQNQTSGFQLVSIKEGGLKVEGDIEILGDNPKIKIGSLVMQDFSRTEITTGTTSNGGQTINFGVVNHLPESFIFGNIVYIEGVDGGRFKSIYSRDMVSFSQYPSNSLSYNLGSCIRFNADEAQLEFITAPISIQNTNGITKAELLAHRSLVIKTPEGLNQPSYIGINKTTPTHALDVVGNIKINTNGNGIIFPDGTKISSLNEINPWAINGNSISYGGNVKRTKCR
ncbi:MAG: hypothetical protein EAZ53_12580 [Bacteroidetes bacterium]|nr:MAG: hypothetical protein EAZ53_12580 [Bacteroidota bacterium]